MIPEQPTPGSRNNPEKRVDHLKSTPETAPPNTTLPAAQ